MVRRWAVVARGHRLIFWTHRRSRATHAGANCRRGAPDLYFKLWAAGFCVSMLFCADHFSAHTFADAGDCLETYSIIAAGVRYADAGRFRSCGGTVGPDLHAGLLSTGQIRRQEMHLHRPRSRPHASGLRPGLPARYHAGRPTLPMHAVAARRTIRPLTSRSRPPLLAAALC